MESGIKVLTETDLADVTTSRQSTFGSLGVTNDWWRYRYVGFATAVTPGQLVVAPTFVAAHQNIAVQTAAPAGATMLYVTLGAAAATQDQYAGGHLLVGVTASGLPVTRKIKGNTAAAANGVCQIFLQPAYPLLNALTTSNTVSLTPSIFNGVTTSTTVGIPVGIVVNSAAAGTYGYVQTWGLAGVVNDAAAALTAQSCLKQSTTVAGAVVASSAATDTQIGQIEQATATGAAGLAYIRLD